jgi:hypothetical protein
MIHLTPHQSRAHKRMVLFQKLINNLFFTLHGHIMHCQQRELSKFLIHYQQFAFHAYCGARGPVSKMASGSRRLFVCSVIRCPDLWLQHSVSFVHSLKGMRHTRMSFFKPCMKLTLRCNHRSGHLKTEHIESLLLLQRHLGNWSLRPAVSMRNVDSSCCWQYMLWPCRMRNKLLSTFEITPFFCVCHVY